mmetsp:Transcript_41190/g.74440  ORF Transcript_41190/g.74440 Transcript_41190/m.74440 type:complete len:246 (+) Transcript_41190:803-1540(+)
MEVCCTNGKTQLLNNLKSSLFNVHGLRPCTSRMRMVLTSLPCSRLMRSTTMARPSSIALTKSLNSSVCLSNSSDATSPTESYQTRCPLEACSFSSSKCTLYRGRILSALGISGPRHLEPELCIFLYKALKPCSFRMSKYFRNHWQDRFKSRSMPRTTRVMNTSPVVWGKSSPAALSAAKSEAKASLKLSIKAASSAFWKLSSSKSAFSGIVKVSAREGPSLSSSCAGWRELESGRLQVQYEEANA